SSEDEDSSEPNWSAEFEQFCEWKKKKKERKRQSRRRQKLAEKRARDRKPYTAHFTMATTVVCLLPGTRTDDNLPDDIQKSRLN
ncbi:hypothetical protein PMAYCL1PPCAC_25166, partial [Pristionchus mayeri]